MYFEINSKEMWELKVLKQLIYRSLGVLLSSTGLLLLMIAAIFHNLTPLSQSSAQRGDWTALLGSLTVLAGAGLTFYLLRQGDSTWKSYLIHGLLVPGLLAWTALGLFIYIIQDSLIFSPRTLSPQRYQAIRELYPQAEEIRIETGSHVLHGWLLPTSTDYTAPLVLVFYGQGGEASRYFELAEYLPNAHWAFINYRGYGLSSGTPSEEALLSDSVTVFDYFSAHPRVDSRHIVALGGSLGTGIAAYLASQRPLAAVVLFSPYDSIAGGVAQDLIPFIPTRWLLRNKFDVMDYARATSVPAMAIIGDADEVIQPERSLGLIENWSGPSLVQIISRGTHYSIYEDQSSWEAIARFLENLNIIISNQ